MKRNLHLSIIIVMIISRLIRKWIMTRPGKNTKTTRQTHLPLILLPGKILLESFHNSHTLLTYIRSKQSFISSLSFSLSLSTDKTNSVLPSSRTLAPPSL
jgi:hypothetical protein